MNLPTNNIHDPLSGYGWLVIPTLKKDRYGNRVWLARFKDHGFRLTDYNGFHNCTKTGVH